MQYYIIQDRETGVAIDSFNTLTEAGIWLVKYEEQDKLDGTYTPNFYEIIERGTAQNDEQLMSALGIHND